jgi:tetratricopeptide (TPR) repeat protein
MSGILARGLLVLGVAAVASPPLVGQTAGTAPDAGRTTAPKSTRPQSPPPQSTPARKTPPKAGPAATAKFDALASKAEEARKGGRLDEAIDLYRQALAIKPDWPEGLWALGTALYELDRFADARDAFRRVLVRHSEDGTAWALKGLCEYRLKNYDTALADLVQARNRGVTGNRSVSEVARYHTAILSTRMEQYEQALAILSDFGLEGNDSPRIVEAMGLATLRLPMLPDELPGERRELVMMAGRAQYFAAARLGSAAQNAFEALTNRYSEIPNVHYAFGVYLLGEQPDAAIEAFKRELEVSPQHVWAKVQIAFALVRRGEYEAAKPWAQQSVEAAPNAFVARNALGQILLETGDIEGAIRELEAGVRLATDSPAMHFSLARAYRRAGRHADADREQAEFTRLDRLVREQRTGTNSLGGIDATPPSKRQP